MTNITVLEILSIVIWYSKLVKLLTATSIFRGEFFYRDVHQCYSDRGLHHLKVTFVKVNYGICPTLNTPAYTSEIVLGLFFHFSLQAAEVAAAQEAAGKNVGHIYKQVLKIKK